MPAQQILTPDPRPQAHFVAQTEPNSLSSLGRQPVISSLPFFFVPHRFRPDPTQASYSLAAAATRNTPHCKFRNRDSAAATTHAPASRRRGAGDAPPPIPPRPFAGSYDFSPLPRFTSASVTKNPNPFRLAAPSSTTDPCALSLRDYGAPAGVVREDNVADIRPPTSSAADIRVSNSIPAPNLHFLHGVPRLSLSVRLDRITPGVLRRLGALPIHSKLLSKVYPVLEHPCVFIS